jgi:ribosome-binding factor A
VQEVLADLVARRVKDPDLEEAMLTFTAVEVSPDLGHAKVHVSVMGDENQQQHCLKGLQRSAGFLQSRIKDRIETRYIPKLEFVLDQGVKQSLEVSRILKEVLPPSEEDETDDYEEVEMDEEGNLEDGANKLETDDEMPDDPSRQPPRDSESP